MIEALRAKATAYVAVLEGDPEAALGPLDQAERLIEPKRELPWIALELADLTLLRARALDRLGRAAEITAPLGEALAIYEQQIQVSEDRTPHFRAARARALLR